jgi:5-aminolevulinate synthase
MGGYIAAGVLRCHPLLCAGFVFMTSLAPAIVAGAIASIRHLQKSSLERERHQERARTLKRRLSYSMVPRGTERIHTLVPLSLASRSGHAPVVGGPGDPLG